MATEQFSQVFEPVIRSKRERLQCGRVSPEARLGKTDNPKWHKRHSQAVAPWMWELDGFDGVVGPELYRAQMLRTKPGLSWSVFSRIQAWVP